MLGRDVTLEEQRRKKEQKLARKAIKEIKNVEFEINELQPKLREQMSMKEVRPANLVDLVSVDSTNIIYRNLEPILDMPKN